MNKIIFITSQNLSEWNYKRFGLEILRKNFEIEYCNIGNLHSNHHLEEIDKKFNNLLKLNRFKNYIHLFKYLYNQDKNVYIIDVCSNNDFVYFLIKKIIHLNGFREIKIFLGSYVESKTSISKRITLLFRKITHKYLLRSYFEILKNYILRKIFNFNYFHYFYSGLEKSSRKNFTYSHAIDYNQYLELKSFYSQEKSKNYIVFLDQAYNSHPEFAFIKSPNFICKNYYDKLQLFLNKVEKLYNCEVIFCAHPRSKKDSSYLRKFKNVKHNSAAQYSKDADLVIAHDSISLNFPILFKKPILLVKIPGMELTNKLNNLNLTTQMLGCRLVDINEKNLDKNLIHTKVDSQKYDEYINKYIKFSGEEKNSWKIISEKLLELQKN